MDYAKIIEGLKGLINEKTSPEDAEKIANISKEVEGAKKEHEDTLIKHEELREKYVKALQQSVFNDKPNNPQSEDKPKTFEECVNEVLAKRDNK